jgi:hypothetical protein
MGYNTYVKYKKESHCNYYNQSSFKSSKFWAWGKAHMVDHLPREWKAPSSNSSTAPTQIEF